jgi:hypothetical protein
MGVASRNRRELKRIRDLVRRIANRTPKVMPASSGLSSTTPADGYQITNLYVDANTGRLSFQYDDALLGVNNSTLTSSPPVGSFAVTNLWYDNTTGRLAFSYDDGT